MKYVLQIKESIFPRLKAKQYYYLGDIDETILYGSVPLFERFLKSGSEFIGFVPFDELTPIEQANILSKVEKSKNHPEFLQYQLLRVVESLKQPNAEEQPPLSSPNLTDSAQPSTSSQLQENEVDEADGDWVRADVWAADHCRRSKKRKELILGNLSSARERSEETQNQYHGRKIFRDRKGREYFKESQRIILYKKEQLENDLEILTSRNH